MVCSQTLPMKIRVKYFPVNIPIAASCSLQVVLKEMFGILLNEHFIP